MFVTNHADGIEFDENDTERQSMYVSEWDEGVDFESYGYWYQTDQDSIREQVFIRLNLENVIALRDYLDAQILRLDKGAD